MARRIGLALGLALGSVLLLLACAFALAQTGPGKRLIAAALERALASPGSTVEIQGLDGLIPFDLRLARLSMADDRGAWLELDGLRLAWSAAALLHGRLQVDDLSAQRIELARLVTSEEPLRLPELPRWLPPTVVERLAVERLALGPEVLGEPATFTLSGRLASSDDGRAATLSLDARRVDQATARASLEARLDLDPATLKLTLTAQETGGLLAALSHRPEAGDFSLKLTGSGPLDAWRGDLRVDAEHLASADARLELALTEPPRLRLDGTLRPVPGLLPVELAKLVGERLGLSLTVTRTAAQRLAVQDLRAQIAAGELTGEAAIDFERERISARAELDLPQLAPLGALIGKPLAGTAKATLTADGALLRPKGRLQLDVLAPSVEGVAARRLETAFDYAVLEPSGPNQLVVQISGDGRAEGLELPEQLPLPARELAWQFDFTGSPDRPVTIRELALHAEPLDLHLSGTIDPTTLAGQAKVGLEVHELGPLSAPLGQRIEGGARLDTDLHIAEGARQIEIDLTGAFERLAGLPPGAAELLGPEPRLRAMASFSPDRRLEITSLTMKGAAATLGGNVALTLPDRTLGGRLTLALPRLAVLSPVLGQELAGSLEVAATPGGSLDAPTIELQARGRSLLLAGRHIKAMALETSARELLAAPEGKLNLALETSGLEAKLATAFRLQHDALALTDLRLSAPRTSIDGNLSIDLARSLVDGALRGDVQDLVAFEPLLPLRLHGQLMFDARLESARQSQTIALAVDGSRLQSDVGRLGRLRLRATVNDALGKPRIEGDLTADEFHQDQIALAHGELTAAGGMDQLILTATLKGEAMQPFKLDGRARLALEGGIRLRLEQLTGQFAGEPLRLAQPAELTVAGADVRLAGLDLRLGDAQLHGDGNLGAREVAAEARLEALPLALLQRFGGPPLSGQANATLRLDGAADNPHGSLDLTATDLRAANLNFTDLPAARLTARAELASRRLNVDVRGEGVTDKPITLTAELPLIARFDSFTFQLPADGQLAGRLDAELSLARMDALAGLDDQTMGGILVANLGLSGTVSAPHIDGTASIDNGTYANGTTGTVLHDLTLRLRASERQIVLEQFAATDGGSGRLSAKGTIDIQPAAHFPIALRADLTDARLVRRDDVDATISGQLQLGGNVVEPKLAGNLKVDPAEIHIPDTVGPNMPVIQVEEVGGTGTNGAATNESERSTALSLDLTVDLPGRIFVRGRGLESEWQGNLHVTGPASEPRVTGTLNVKRGYFDLLDRRLQLGDGVVSFSGESPPDPTVTVQATTDINGMMAIIRVEGRARQPTLTLDSQPPLPQDEILARLLFNRDASQMSPVQAAQLALAVNRLRGGGPDVMDKLRSLTGLDTLDVTGGQTMEEGKVRAGKYLNDNVYVGVEQGTTAETGRAKVEVQILPDILPSLSVEADTGANAQSGVGIKWRYNY